jgi:hypothetical protein
MTFIKAERKRSFKASHAAAWGTSQVFRDNWDAIFRKKCDATCCYYNVLTSALVHLESITNASNVHKLAQYKQLCMNMECDTCEKNSAKVREFIYGLQRGSK